MIAAFLLSKTILDSFKTFYSYSIWFSSRIIIAKITEYYTSGDYKPVKEIAKESETGAATNIIGGLSVGMMSTAYPIVVNMLLVY